ncbi:MAG: protein phosphatase 2C domain-containing protein [Actinomycetota bacterium]|nr:protein phosphatase 2C domain-containing protein [Actinomycetota bacterium]
MTLVLRYAARSDVGLIRDSNQDSFYAGPRLLAVADGMGGHAAGDVASRVVISTLSALDDDAVGGAIVDMLRKATYEANEMLRAMVEGDRDLDGMGTTLTALLFAGNRLGMVHVGDSRGYLLRGGELSQITHDDTFVQSLVDDGRITAEEASTHPQRNLILRVLTGSEVEPHFSVREAVAGDRYLLCSDGLSGVVSDETIAEALQIADPHDAADRLVELALRGGAPDNVTCVVADVVNATQGPDEPVVGGAVAANQSQRPPSANTAAGRAALARPARPEHPVAAQPADPDNRLRRRLTWGLAGLVLVVLLGAGGWAGWNYLLAQYYVGSTPDGAIAIYRGVSGGVAGIELHRLDQRTDLLVSDLQPAARGQLHSGIPATSRRNAEQVLDRLRRQQLPPCTPRPVPEGSASPTPTPKPSVPAKPAPSPKPGASPSVSPSPIPMLRPGIDCREAH